ncbi:MAG: hypothetical protein H6569_05200 [Lewinellaceae bacterium]|nr:hypothetical protein [Lewinellaceae bacterium]
MATASKKRGAIQSIMGRPPAGALSTFEQEVVERVKQLRQKYCGWGATSILDALQQVFPSDYALPSIDSINRYLKQAGLVTKYEPHGKFPKQPCLPSKAAHDLWEMDAQGAVLVSGMGYLAMINIKDVHTKTHCMAFPVPVRHSKCQPSQQHYQWTLRLAFEEIGLPLGIQVDKGSIFYENTTKSPFPTPLHLWLVALGVNMCPINLPPPQKQSVVERSHQTMERQVLRGQHYEYWGQLLQHSYARRHRLNQNLPNRSLGNKAPWQVFPRANQSTKSYSVEQEHNLLNPQLLYNFLAQGTWYRTVSSVRTISLGGHRYYLKTAKPKSQIQITFDPNAEQFCFRDVNELCIAQLAPKGLSKNELMRNSSANLASLMTKILKSPDFPL